MEKISRKKGEDGLTEKQRFILENISEHSVQSIASMRGTTVANIYGVLKILVKKHLIAKTLPHYERTPLVPTEEQPPTVNANDAAV